jgi:hypothetical protein
MTRNVLRVAIASGAAAFALIGPALPAQATLAPDSNAAGSACFDPVDVGAAARGATNVRAGDHRDISASEQRQIEARTAKLLAAKAGTKGKPGASPSVATANLKSNIPVYVHVMTGTDGSGDVTNTQIADQITVLNQTYSGHDVNGAGYNTGVAFTLAGINRYANNSWHHDRLSTKYRAATRQGGKNALNIWLVDFKYLGIATFPWDYASNPGIDGIRVQYNSIPGGDIVHYNLGETATHEAGHWLGLYHTFQGGCTATNDEVADTPAQSSPTTGCPVGRDSCPTLAGLDPIHNYMDYSYDDCYTTFSAGQSTRITTMWNAYRA